MPSLANVQLRTPHAPPAPPTHTRTLPKPGPREFYGGLAILMVLGGVILVRDTGPRSGMAADQPAAPATQTEPLPDTQTDSPPAASPARGDDGEILR